MKRYWVWLKRVREGGCVRGIGGVFRMGGVGGIWRWLGRCVEGAKGKGRKR